MNFAERNLDDIQDGIHTIAKKGDESVAYPGRKKTKTSNIRPVVEKDSYVVASTTIIAGNHNDSFEIKDNLYLVFALVNPRSVTS